MLHAFTYKCLLLIALFTSACAVARDSQNGDIGLYSEGYFTTNTTELIELKTALKTNTEFLNKSLLTSEQKRREYLKHNWLLLIAAESSSYRNDYKEAWYWLRSIHSDSQSPRLQSRVSCAEVIIRLSTSALSLDDKKLVNTCTATENMQAWEKQYALLTQKLAFNRLYPDSLQTTEVVIEQDVAYPNIYRQHLSGILTALQHAFNGQLDEALNRLQVIYTESQTLSDSTIYYAATQNYAALLMRSGKINESNSILLNALKKARQDKRVADQANILFLISHYSKLNGEHSKALLTFEEGFNLALRKKLIQYVYLNANNLVYLYSEQENMAKLQLVLDRVLHFTKRIAFYEDFEPQIAAYSSLQETLIELNISHSVTELKPENLLTREKRLRLNHQHNAY